MYGLSFRLYFKNRVLSTITFSSIFFCVVYLLCAAFKTIGNGFGDVTDALVAPVISVNKLSWFVILFFLFAGYEYLVQSKKWLTEETVTCTAKGNKNTYLYQILVLESILVVLFLIFFIYTYVYIEVKGELGLEYAKYIFINYLLNVLILGNIGIFIGMATALVCGKKRLASYVCLFIFAVFCGPIGSSLIELIYNYTGLNLYCLSNFLYVLPPSLDFTVDFSFITSILPYRFSMAFFWILLAITAITLVSVSNKKERISCVIMPLCGCALSLCFLILAVVPQSRVVRNSSPYEFNYADGIYYNKNYINEEITYPDVQIKEFRVTSYEMEFSAVRQLSAVVTMTVDHKDLDVYGFSLYHGYKVKSITDQDGSPLTFEQDKDYIIIKNDGRFIEKIIMRYKGYSPSLYSNIQGLNLPGNFAYYPHAGFKDIYDIAGHNINSVFTPENTEFDISFRYPKSIYCNLPSVGENHFHGKSNGVTLISGFYEEKKIGGFTVVMPYLNSELNYEPYQKKVISELEELNNSVDFEKQFKDKVIFVIPLPNSSPTTTVLQDHIINTSSWFALPEQIAKIIETESIGD